MTDFVRIGNRILNVAHVISMEFVPKINAISGPDDPRVIDGRAKWNERCNGWIDEDGDEILARPSRLTITTSATAAETVYSHTIGPSVVATSVVFTVYGIEAEAVMQWFASRAAAPVTDEHREVA